MTFSALRFASLRALVLSNQLRGLEGDRNQSEAEEELEDLLTALAMTDVTGVSMEDAALVAVALRCARPSDAPSAPPETPTREPRAGSADEAPAASAAAPAAKSRRKPTSTDADSSHHAARTAEMAAIGQIVTRMRHRADELGGQIRTSDGVVSNAAGKFSALLQSVKSNSAAVDKLSGAKSGLAYRIPVLGSWLLGPIVAMLLQVLWLAIVVAITGVSLGMVLMMPRGRMLVVEAPVT